MTDPKKRADRWKAKYSPELAKASCDRIYDDMVRRYEDSVVALCMAEAKTRQVLNELARYPADKRKKLYAKLIAKAKKELGTCKVYSTKADQELLQLPYGVTHVGFFDGPGGLIFESADGSLRLDYRFESMLEDVWNKNIQEIFARFFG